MPVYRESLDSHSLASSSPPPLSLGFALTLALFQRQSLFIFFLYIIGSYINRLLHAKDNKMKLQIK